MARVGRGRSRGGRILDISTLAISIPGRGMGHGRIMAGRGTSVVAVEKLKEDPSAYLNTNAYKTADVEEEIKKTLEEKLLEFEKSKKGCLIHITLNYFASSDDAQLYIDKVMDSLLRSSFMVEKFTMSFRLITLIKIHGENIKLKMFSKLQTVFQDMNILMKDSSKLSADERESVKNFCELLGQLYFRFRLHLDSLERYNVLASPAIECMTYLVKARGHQELLILVKLIVFNYSALCELHQEKMNQLCLDIHTAIIHTPDDLERTWLLCALDFVNFHPSELPSYIMRFYAEILEEHGWARAVAKPHTLIQVLADIPSDIVKTKMDQFNVSVEEYNKHRFVTF